MTDDYRVTTARRTGPHERGRSRRISWAVAAGVAAVCVAAAATGCVPSNENRKRLVRGATANVPSGQKPWVKVRNLFVLGPAQGRTLQPGANAPAYAYITSRPPDGKPDKLLSVSSPVFTGSRITTGNGVALPPGRLVQLRSGDKPLVILTGLTKALGGIESIPLTLVFERAGRVQVQHAPVVERRDKFGTYPPAPSP